MRPILLPLLVLTLALGLAACGDAPATTDAGAAATGAPGATGSAGDAAAGDAAAAKAAGEAGSCCEKAGEGACCQEEGGKAVCVCAAGKAGAPIWCEACKKGYVDGKEVCCPKCVQKAIDAAAAKAKAGGSQ